jgi:ribosomal protein S18 acetylase RimI-like enzyme
MTTHSIRPIVAADVPGLKSVVDATGLFSGELLDDMLADYLAANATGELWLVDIGADGPRGLAYCAPERMTEGTWNLYLIALHPDAQRQGRGRALLAEVERLLQARDARVLLVETSGLPEFEATRAFYAKCAFVQEARIRDFYRAGEDKIVFWKALAPLAS